MKKTEPHEHDWQDYANLNAKCTACGQIQRWTSVVAELRERAQSARRDALIEAAHDCLAIAEDTGHATGWMKAANACAAAIGKRLVAQPFPPVESLRGLAADRVRVFLAEAKRYAAAGEHGGGHDADELTVKDVANGYREGYKRLHNLVSQVAPWLDQLLGERSPT
jgi:hypothetical protein